jgi:hypothetical protein
MNTVPTSPISFNKRFKHITSVFRTPLNPWFVKKLYFFSNILLLRCSHYI